MTASGRARLHLVALIHACLVCGGKKTARRLGVVRAYQQTKSKSRPCKVFAHATCCVGFDDRIDACRRKRAPRDIYLGPASERPDDNKLPVLHFYIIRGLRKRGADSKSTESGNSRSEIGIRKSAISRWPRGPRRQRRGAGRIHLERWRQGYCSGGLRTSICL